MNKILISIGKEYVSFSKYNRNISEDNLNNTNVINVKSLKFTEDYIYENLELVSTFLNLVFMKFKINTVVIKNMEIAETSLKLLEKINLVKYINFIEEKELSYTVSTLLYENKNIEKIKCYNLPEIMFYRFEKNKIETRSKILSSSDFFKNNDISTYSQLFNKDKIVIHEYLSEDDVNDMVYFFNTNVNLLKIEFKRYSKQNLITILKLLKRNNVKNVTIIIYENKATTQDIMKDIKDFDIISKQYCVKIKIRYSKEYKEKNRVKELNLILLKNIVVGCIILFSLIFLLYKLLELKDNKLMKNNMSAIEDKLNLQENENIYYKNYSRVYKDLLELNSDTVGWLTVNNTKVNYPVVQTTDNDYYLSHAYDKSNNIAGWIFADYRCDMNSISKNTIIYGHSLLRNELMLSTLKNILDSGWYSNQDNLNISFSIKETEYNWRIFSIYTIENTTDYLYTDFNTDVEYINFIEKIRNRSINDFGIQVNSSDKILTISTCYNTDDVRIVVHAKMI